MNLVGESDRRTPRAGTRPGRRAWRHRRRRASRRASPTRPHDHGSNIAPSTRRSRSIRETSSGSPSKWSVGSVRIVPSRSATSAALPGAGGTLRRGVAELEEAGDDRVELVGRVVGDAVRRQRVVRITGRRVDRRRRARSGRRGRDGPSRRPRRAPCRSCTRGSRAARHRAATRTSSRSRAASAAPTWASRSPVRSMQSSTSGMPVVVERTAVDRRSRATHPRGSQPTG